MIKFKNKNIVLFLSIFFLIFLIFLFYETSNMSKSILPGYPGDAFFPRLILIFTFFWTVILFLQNTLKNNILINYFDDNNFTQNLKIKQNDIDGLWSNLIKEKEIEIEKESFCYTG